MRKLLLILILCTLFFVNPVHSDAIIDHGLYWGVEEGQVFNYTLTATGEDQSVSYGISMHVTYLPVIPIDVSEHSDISSLSVAVFDENNTYIPFLGLDLMSNFPTGLPIGNWVHITTIFEDAWANREDLYVSQTATTWGVIQTGETFFGGYTLKTNTQFSKADGMVVSMTWEKLSDLIVAARVTIERSSGDLLIPLVIAGGAAVAVIGVVIVFLKKRKLSPI